MSLLNDLRLNKLASWNATMTSYESSGFLHRMLTALGRALRRGILGKSSHDYMKQFRGSDEYWDRVIAAQVGGPEKQLPKPDPNRIHSSGHAVVHARPGVRSSAPSPPQPDYEPVHGWTKRQYDHYMDRNLGYLSRYEAELQKRWCAVFTRGNGSSRD